MSRRVCPELETLIGEEAYIRLAEAFGGTPLYIPKRLDEDHEIAKAIGIDAARKLVDRLAPDVVMVPLAREARALHYRATGDSNTQIARKLGMSISGVERLFSRRPDAPAKVTRQDDRQDDRQLGLFED